MFVHFHNPNGAYKHLYNLHQKFVPPLQLIVTSLFCPYLFIKSFSQSAIILPFSLPQQFFTSLFLRAALPTIYIKSISLRQLFSQFMLRQGTSEQGSIVRTDTVLASLFFLKVQTGITGITIIDFLLLRLRVENHSIQFLRYRQPIVITSIPYKYHNKNSNSPINQLLNLISF